jgi:hypothetical protein
MKSFFIIFAVVFFTSSCSSNETTTTEKGDFSNSQTNVNNSVAVNQNQSTLVPYNGVNNMDSNAFNSNNASIKQVNRSVNNNQSPIQRTAPDNSTVFVTMDKSGNPIETRTFTNHQVLIKVERISIGKDVKYKVYLKNGKVVEAPVDKMENFTALHPNNILAAIGLPPPTPRPEERVPEMQKPKQ